MWILVSNKSFQGTEEWLSTIKYKARHLSTASTDENSRRNTDGAIQLTHLSSKNRTQIKQILLISIPFSYSTHTYLQHKRLQKSTICSNYVLYMPQVVSPYKSNSAGHHIVSSGPTTRSQPPGGRQTKMWFCGLQNDSIRLLEITK